jgi:Domain of unknown function (DUF4286)
MTVYNMTAKVSPDVADEWLAWQQQDHIPEIMKTGLFENYRLYRLTEPADADGVTFVIQFFADSPVKCTEYANTFAPQMETKANARWKGDHVFFCSIMEAVN